MSTSYADSAQAREWDRLHDAYGRPKKVHADQFHDYEAERSQRLDARRQRDLAERKATAERISIAVEQIGDFFGLNGVKP